MKEGQIGYSSHFLPKEEEEEEKKAVTEVEEEARRTIPNLVVAVWEDEDEDDEHDEHQSGLRNWDPSMRQSRNNFHFLYDLIYVLRNVWRREW